MKLKDIIIEMSMVDLRSAEYAIEGLFKELALDVVWSTHFKERILDREANMQAPELVDAFRKLKEKYGDRLQQARDDHERFVGVLKDISSELNIPFAIDFDRKDPRNNKYRMRGITIMRKQPTRFKTNIAGGEELKVEGIEDEERDHYVDLPAPATKKQIKRDGQRKKPYPTTSKSQNKAINMLWDYSNADAT